MTDVDIIRSKLFVHGVFRASKLASLKKLDWLQDYSGSTIAEKAWNVLYTRPFCRCGSGTSFISFKQGYRKNCSLICAGHRAALQSSSRQLSLWGNEEWRHKTISAMKIAHFANKHQAKLQKISELQIYPLQTISPGFDTTYTWKHSCGSIFQKSLKRTASICCPKCHVTSIRGEVFEIVRDLYSGLISISEKSVLSGFDLQLYLSDLRLAIEIKKTQTDRLLEKIFEAQEANIHLLVIYENEWRENRELQKELILKAITRLLVRAECHQ